MAVSCDILACNLAALTPRQPDLVERLRAAAPAPLEWSQARDGRWTASLNVNGRSLQLASRYDPLAEARRIIAGFEPTRHGAAFVLGLGVGHHVSELSEAMGDDAVLVVYEPSLPLVRAVFEKMDHTGWLKRGNVLLLDEPVDRPALLTRLEPFAAILTQGTALVHHPPTRQLHPRAVAAFGELVAEVLRYCRIHVATALVNASRTVHNLTANLAHYAAGESSDSLFGAAAGFAAVCVSAGPSLARNVHLLADPQVRRRVVVITAQTTLKPLLARGIRPDFVTALDYHEISRRFYEGLSGLHDVTLVAEPKAHPSIIDSFPGPVRLLPNALLDRVLERGAAGRRPLPSGATVAHLSVYLAQHLGCDPIILIGQDLAFSDGLYYCPGTAIHEVWAPELGPYNTLEMLEWQRIVRHRNHLHKRVDVNGREVYTDEQMTTYLQQFERDFAQAGQKIIDATEGGLPKQHTTAMALCEALAHHAQCDLPALPAARRNLDADRMREALATLRRRIDQVQRIRQITHRTIPLMRQMREHQRDYPRASALFEQIQAHRRQVDGPLAEAFALVNQVNSVGAFNRARADRAIAHAGADAFETQRRQIERDLANLQWIEQACDETLRILRGALARMQAAAHPTDGCEAPPVPLAAAGARG